jgi:hypothetical protein
MCCFASWHSEVGGGIFLQIVFTHLFLPVRAGGGGPLFSNSKCKQIIRITTRCGGPGSVVGIATGYGLGGSGIESRWGQDNILMKINALHGLIYHSLLTLHGVDKRCLEMIL